MKAAVGEKVYFFKMDFQTDTRYTYLRDNQWLSQMYAISQTLFPVSPAPRQGLVLVDHGHQ